MPTKPTKNNDGNRRRDRGDQTRINERIRAPRVRVVTANGDQLGVMNTRDALEKARALGLDLVEVAGNADPPLPTEHGGAGSARTDTNSSPQVTEQFEL